MDSECQVDKEHFRYYIAGGYQGGKVPEGMKVIEIPAVHKPNSWNSISWYAVS